jgi:hypothetical protein
MGSAFLGARVKILIFRGIFGGKKLSNPFYSHLRKETYYFEYNFLIFIKFYDFSKKHDVKCFLLKKLKKISPLVGLIK